MGNALIFAVTSAISIGFGVVFWTVVQTFFNGIGSFVATSLVGELFNILSLCLPFSLVQLLAGVGLIANSILTFLVARKVFTMLSNLLGISKG